VSGSHCWHLYCDTSGCGRRFVHGPVVDGNEPEKIGETRAAAQLAGWTSTFTTNPRGHGPGWTSDYCPSCSVQRAAVAEVA